MSDEEAVLRLQSILVSACEGNQDLLNGREYRSLRSPLIRRDDLADVVPRYIKAHRDLGSFWSYIKGVSGQWAPRRQHVWDTFKPLFNRVEGRTKSSVAASRWTGRRKASKQARVVLALGSDALLGVELLLDEQERPLHNGGPVEPEQLEAIEKLKELHQAIGELIRLAEAELPLDHQIQRVRDIKDRLIHSKSSWSVTRHTPSARLSTVLGVGVMGLVNAIWPGQGTAFGVAAMAAHPATAAVKATLMSKKGSN